MKKTIVPALMIFSLMNVYAEEIQTQEKTKETNTEQANSQETVEEELKINDPLEAINRKVYSFNKGVDKVVLKPASQVYDTVTPNLVQKGVSNFMNYLKSPWNIVNYTLQGNKEEVGHAMSRFLVNTFGLGVFDIASQAQIPLHNTNLGDTLGVWGVPDGPYVVLPVLGGNTLRDSTALVAVEMPLSIQSQLPAKERNYLIAVDILQTRTDLDSAITTLESIALDEYSFVRDAQIQRRKAKIEKLKNKEE